MTTATAPTRKRTTKATKATDGSASAKPQASSPKPKASVISLHPWQRRYLDLTGRTIALCWHRQAGKDFSTACRAVDHAFTTGQHWFITSLTQRQANATFQKCRQVAEAYKAVLKKRGEVVAEAEEFGEYDRQLDHTFRFTKQTLALPGGGSVTALPGREPDTLAGLSGNVIITEFGLYPNAGQEHFRVINPITNRGYMLFLISTPRGRNHKFYEIVSAPDDYVVNVQTLPQSLSEDPAYAAQVLVDGKGEPCTYERFRELYRDDVGFRREYLCEFTGDAEALLSWALLQDAGEAKDVRVLEISRDSGWNPRFFAELAAPGSRAEIGWDVARHSDLSVLWVNRRIGGKRKLTHLVVMSDCTFAMQRSVVMSAMDARRDHVGCGDATGLGMDSNETLQRRYRDRWVPVTFTTTTKAELGSLARTAFDDRDQLIPPMDGTTKWIANDLYSVQADRSGDRLHLMEQENVLRPESHCDVFYAFALARKAASIRGASLTRPGLVSKPRGL